MPIESPVQVLSAAAVREAPDAPGVYALLHQEEVIFYGRSTVSVRAALMGHRRCEDDSPTRVATHFQIEVCDDARTREEELLQEHLEMHGVYPWCNQLLQQAT